MPERRRAPRVGIRVAAELLLPGHAPWHGTLSNISASGTLFVAPPEGLVNQSMYGVVSISQSDAQMNAVARVTRLAGSRRVRCEIGLEFVYPSDATKDAIRRLAGESEGTA